MSSVDNTASEQSSAVAFGGYAAWYDAFNQNKRYDVEVDYLLRCLADDQFAPPRRWLDIGCGTGRHLADLHARGIDCDGVEASSCMVAQAQARHPGIRVHQGSAQQFALSGLWDVASMLFHVINYQTSDDMVRGALTRAAAHLVPGGALLLDFWNSDAVAQDPPTYRARQIRVEDRPLFRISIPTECRGERRIDVLYQFRWDSADGPLLHEELHRMRHFTRAELETFLRAAGFAPLRCLAWMTERPLTADDWYGLVCARSADPS